MPKRKNAAPAEPDRLSDGMVVLHRSTFVEWQPSPIVAMSASNDGSLSVAVRENGDVELYETSSLHYLQRIPGNVDAVPTSVAVVDAGDDVPCRIFTAGLDGHITELDIESGRQGANADSFGGAVWQLAVEPTPQTLAAEPGSENVKESENQPANDKETDSEGESDSDESDEDEGLPAHCPRLAVACDDGCVRLFSVEPGMPGVSYAKSLPKVEGRTLAVAWHPSGKFIVSGGSDGCIHVWEVSSNREALRITAGDASGSELCVWSLIVLPDGTIVAGDSGGNVTFWDGRFGTLIGRFNQHHADVLQLAAAPDGATVFASGVDPRVAVFQCLRGQPGSKSEWTFLSSKRPHTHDVRAMCIAAGKSCPTPMLFTGGNDTLLLAHNVSRFLKEHPKKVNACPQRPIIQAAPAVQPPHTDAAEPWLMATAQNRVDLWRLARPASASRSSGEPPIEGDRLPLQSVPLHLLRIVNRSGDFLTAAAMSLNGRFLAYSDAQHLRCFTLSSSAPLLEGLDDSTAAAAIAMMPKVEVSPVPLPSDFPPACHLFFLPESDALVAIAADGIVRIVRMRGVEFPSTGGDSSDDKKVEKITEQNGSADEDEERKERSAGVHTIRDLHDLRYKMWFKRDRARSAARRAAPTVEFAALSPDGKLLAAAVRGRVHLLPLEGHKIAAAIPPPAEHTPLAALGFTPDGGSLIIVTAANQVVAYQIPTGVPAEWSVQHPPEALPRRLLTLPGPVHGIAASPAGPSSVLLFSCDAVCHVDLAAPVSPEPSGKKKRQRDSAAVRTATPAGENCRALYCSDPVLHVEALGGGDVVVVERPWREVHAGLAPPMYRHRYGT